MSGLCTANVIPLASAQQHQLISSSAVSPSHISLGFSPSVELQEDGAAAGKTYHMLPFHEPLAANRREVMTSPTQAYPYNAMNSFASGSLPLNAHSFNTYRESEFASRNVPSDPTLDCQNLSIASCNDFRQGGQTDKAYLPQGFHRSSCPTASTLDLAAERSPTGMSPEELEMCESMAFGFV